MTAARCPDCQGTGRADDKVCQNCQGVGRVEPTSKSDVLLPGSVSGIEETMKKKEPPRKPGWFERLGLWLFT